MRILLLGEVAATGLLRGIGLLPKSTLLLTETVLLLAKTILLLAKSILLLSEGAWLLLPIHLAGGSSYLSSADRYGLVGTAQQHIGLVHDWVIDKLPLVVRLLLVVNADGWIFAEASHPNDRSAPEGLTSASRVLREW